MTKLTTNQDEIIDLAVSRLKADKVIALPTETVYGLAASIASHDAIRKVYQIKQRPQDHPLIMHVSNFTDLAIYARDIPDYVTVLIEAFWPGPLTLILNKTENTPDFITGGQDTVAIRMPNHPLLLQIIRKFGLPLAAPSANKFGGISPTEANHVISEFMGQVEVIDGGKCSHGIESTIIDARDNNSCIILRPGPLSEEMLKSALSHSYGHVKIGSVVKSATRFPGGHKKHYAPQKPLIGFYSGVNLSTLVEKYANFFLIHHTNVNLNTVKSYRFPVSPALFAKELYQVLRLADASDCETILIEMPPIEKEWQAINDRLNRAITLLIQE